MSLLTIIVFHSIFDKTLFSRESVPLVKNLLNHRREKIQVSLYAVS